MSRVSLSHKHLFPGISGVGNGLLQVDPPRCLAVEILVCCITLPKALDKRSSRRDLAIEVLLPLLLLNFEGKARSKDALEENCMRSFTSFCNMCGHHEKISPLEAQRTILQRQRNRRPRSCPSRCEERCRRSQWSSRWSRQATFSTHVLHRV